MTRRPKEKLAYLKFFPTDWRSDPRLRMCSAAARGLWIEIMCLMHEAEPYGHLLVSGQRPTDAQLAVLAGIPPDHLPDLLGELEAAGVFSRTGQGAIYSRRMTRDEKKRRIARKNGKSGGNPSLGNNKVNLSSDNPPEKGQDKTQRPEARVQRRGESYDSRAFDAFWEVYPRREGKKAAAAKFKTAVKSGTSPEQIIAGAERYAAHCRENRIETRFQKHPTTWLNQGCWEDELRPQLATIDGGRSHDGKSPREARSEDKLRSYLAFADDLDRQRERG